jgi:hexosaminidase
VDPSAVIGIESPLWTETVRTLDQAQRLLMPRLAVLAEVGWSQPSRRGWADLRERVAAQAPLWTALGIAFHRDPEVPWEKILGSGLHT